MSLVVQASIHQCTFDAVYHVGRVTFYDPPPIGMALIVPELVSLELAMSIEEARALCASGERFRITIEPIEDV